MVGELELEGGVGRYRSYGHCIVGVSLASVFDIWGQHSWLLCFGSEHMRHDTKWEAGVPLLLHFERISFLEW